MQRINVSSGRPLENKANYSRALRFGDLAIQSGTTAIDREGNVLGDSVEEQIDQILKLASITMGEVDSDFEDIVRARLYVTGADLVARAKHKFLENFPNNRFALSVFPISALARPAQLIEIELETIDDSRHTSEPSSSSQLLKLGNKLLIGGVIGSGDSVEQQAANAVKSIIEAVEAESGGAQDLLNIRIFNPYRGKAAETFSAIGAVLGDCKPTFTHLCVPNQKQAFANIVIEAEAELNSSGNTVCIPDQIYPMFSALIATDQEIFMSMVEPVDDNAQTIAANDWGGQRDACISKFDELLKRVDASLDDVINRRFYTAAHAEMNRGYGDGPPWFANTKPAALGCRTLSHSREDIVIAMDAHAIRGAGNNIEWRSVNA